MALVLTGCAEKAATTAPSNLPLLQSHFAGMTQVVQGNGASKLKDIWALPATTAVRKEALDKIASAPFQLWQKSLPSGARDQAGLVRPLLDDLFASESVVQLGGAGAKYDSVIAIELDDTRAQLWSSNLWQIVSGWKLGTPQPLTGTAKGWETHAKGIAVQVQRSGKWLVAGWSLGKLGAAASAAESIANSGRPAAALRGPILDLQADFPSLAKWNSLLVRYPLPVSRFVISPHRDGESLRTDAQFSFSQALNSKAEAWQIPTNQISDPLISFTVAQGIEPLFKLIPGFHDFRLQTPHQICGWANGVGSFKTYWAFPQAGASNLVKQLTSRVQPFLKHYYGDNPPGNLLFIENRNQLTWAGLPLMEPTVNAFEEGGKDYLVFGLWPFSPGTKPAPAELFAQLNNRTNLVYYDWELTQQRLDHFKVLYQAIDMSHLRRLAPTNAPSLAWVDQAGPKLGNTVTEITQASPRELKLVRKSQVGFTGFELATLLRWIESPAFPLGYEPPPTVQHPQGRGAVRKK